MSDNNAERSRVVIIGGTGFLGLNLAQFLHDADYEVCVIGRSAPKRAGPWRFVTWDAVSLGSWAQELESATAVVNLAGRTVDCIKTPDNIDVILRSRVETTKLIGRALRQLQNPPSLWIQMSTAHIYGDPPSQQCTEQSAFGYGLAPHVGVAWEAAHAEALLPEMRSVVLRTSFVLGLSGGALPTLALLCKLRLGGTVGAGSQGMSWLHEVDMNQIFLRALQDEAMNGAYIASAPKPVSNKIFMQSLRRAMRVKIGLPAFAWMVKIGAPLLFDTDPELALYGRYCIPQRLLDEGFEFQHADIEVALRELFNQ